MKWYNHTVFKLFDSFRGIEMLSYFIQIFDLFYSIAQNIILDHQIFLTVRNTFSVHRRKYKLIFITS